MKKIILMSAASIGLMYAENTMTVSQINCDSGSVGFELRISNPAINKSVVHNSCLRDQEPLIVVDNEVGSQENGSSSENQSGSQSVTIDNIEYTFVNGYTTPTVAASNDCAGGFDNSGVNANQQCEYLGLGELSEGYLNLTAVDTLQLHGNNLTNVDNLSNLTSANVLILDLNSLENLNGLKNLTSVNDLYLKNNNLTNVNELSNLESVNKMYLQNNNITDLSGLNNITSITGFISLDKKNYDVKIDASSYICENYDSISSKILNQYNQAWSIVKSEICYN